MMMRLKQAALATGIAFAAMVPVAPMALAQEVTVVLNTNEVGAQSYNPIKSPMLNTATGMIFDRLVEQDADLSFHPHLAESWEEAADGMSWVFHLKKGVSFHNGEPFNANTIPAWLELFKEGDNAYMTEAVDKVEVVDDYTVKFVMKHADPNLLYNLSSTFMAVPEPKTYKALGDKFGVTEAIGTGPFKLESFTVGSETVLTRNDAYTWGSPLSQNAGPAKIEKLTFREIAEESTAFLELKTGGVDMLLGVPNDFLGELKSEAKVATLTMPGREVAYMPINVTSAPFTDIRVREAAAKAINQEEILAAVYGGVGSVADSFLISALPESKVDPKYLIKYDPARANPLLDEAGWKMAADGVRAKDGAPLSVTLWTQSDTVFKRLAEVVQGELKAVGIAAEISTFDSSTIRDQYKSGKQQLAVRSYEWDNPDIIDWFFGGDRLGYPNVSMFNDPKAEELRTKAMSGSATGAERTANFRVYHEYVLSQFPFAPLYQPVVNVGYNKDRLVLPEKIRGTQIGPVSVMDITVK
jgi:peptide/nickel transport system substrate-binding protein